MAGSATSPWRDALAGTVSVVARDVPWADAREAVLQAAAALQATGEPFQLQLFLREPGLGMDAALLGGWASDPVLGLDSLGTQTTNATPAWGWSHSLDGGGSYSDQQQALEQAFERLRDEAEVQADLQVQASVGTLAVSTSLSVGYVLWLARGGALLASLASSIPAWASMDPLPVLARPRRRHGDDDDIEEFGGRAEDEAMKPDTADRLERLFSRAREVFTARGSTAAVEPAHDRVKPPLEPQA